MDGGEVAGGGVRGGFDWGCRSRPLSVLLRLEIKRRRRIESSRSRLEAKVPIASDEDDVRRVDGDESTIRVRVDDGEATREVVLLPGDGAEDDVVHAPRKVVREADDSVKVSAVAGKVDVLAANGEVLEVVASARLDLEMARVGADGGFEVGDRLACGGPERGGVLLESVQLGDHCETRDWLAE